MTRTLAIFLPYKFVAHLHSPTVFSFHTSVSACGCVRAPLCWLQLRVTQIRGIHLHFYLEYSSSAVSNRQQSTNKEEERVCVFVLRLERIAAAVLLLLQSQSIDKYFIRSAHFTYSGFIFKLQWIFAAIISWWICEYFKGISLCQLVCYGSETVNWYVYILHINGFANKC